MLQPASASTVRVPRTCSRGISVLQGDSRECCYSDFRPAATDSSLSSLSSLPPSCSHRITKLPKLVVWLPFRRLAARYGPREVIVIDRRKLGPMAPTASVSQVVRRCHSIFKVVWVRR